MGLFCADHKHIISMESLLNPFTIDKLCIAVCKCQRLKLNRKCCEIFFFFFFFLEIITQFWVETFIEHTNASSQFDINHFGWVANSNYRNLNVSIRPFHKIEIISFVFASRRQIGMSFIVQFYWFSFLILVIYRYWRTAPFLMIQKKKKTLFRMRNAHRIDYVDDAIR